MSFNIYLTGECLQCHACDKLCHTLDLIPLTRPLQSPRLQPSTPGIECEVKAWLFFVPSFHVAYERV